MSCVSRLDRITSDPSICHGQPTIRGLRYPVENLLERLASDMTIDEVLEDHPDLERVDLLAALEFGALGSGMRRVVPLDAVWIALGSASGARTPSSAVLAAARRSSRLTPART